MPPVNCLNQTRCKNIIIIVVDLLKKIVWCHAKFACLSISRFVPQTFAITSASSMIQTSDFVFYLIYFSKTVLSVNYLIMIITVTRATIYTLKHITCFNSLPISPISTITPTTLKYFCKIHVDQRIFFNLNYHKCLSWLFPIHLITYVMGLWTL